MNKAYKAFTLMEVVIVIVIIGIIAAFGLPNYVKSVARANAKDAAANLRIIASALQVYRAQVGGWPDAADLEDVNEINQTLAVSIIPNNMTYSCDDTAGFQCNADSPSGWQLQIDETTTLPFDPYCSSGVGTCPRF
jgi:prepilin-type N-terminal cleavage/methylation domain-containing protein